MRKLKVVEFTPRFGFGGTEKTLYTFCKFLDREKFDVTACALDSDPASGREQAIRDLGIETRVSSENYLAKYLKSLNADVFHIHRAGWPEQGAITAAKEAGIPVVVEHNVFGRVDDSPENDLIDCHIFISYSCAWRYQMWTRKPLVTSKYETLYYPLDIDMFDNFGFPNRAYPANAVGRIGRDDNTKWEMGYLAALAEVAKEIPDFTFHVIGETPEVVEKIADLGLADNIVKYPMTTSETELMKFYSNISALAHMAEMGETFGLVLAEAMAARLPVVTHQTPAFKDSAQTELISNAYNGFVAVDPGMYAEALIYLLTDTARCKEMGEAGYQKARELYDAPVITRGLEEIFKDHAARKGII